MLAVGDNDSCKSGHDRILSSRRRLAKEINLYGVPRLPSPDYRWYPQITYGIPRLPVSPDYPDYPDCPPGSFSKSSRTSVWSSAAGAHAMQTASIARPRRPAGQGNGGGRQHGLLLHAMSLSRRPLRGESGDLVSITDFLGRTRAQGERNNRV